MVQKRSSLENLELIGIGKRMVKLLDCTLRDGGFVNDWEFGHDNIINIFERLVSSGVDTIETCFLDERREMDINRTIYPDTETAGWVFGKLDKGNAMIVGMIDYGTCGIERLKPCRDSFLDGIRVIFKHEKKAEAIAFCKQIKDLGYEVFAQAVSITSYDDEELLELLGLVNDLEPYAFSLVDTYGLLHKKLLQHYFDIADRELKPSIAIGYHSHNNFQLAYSNCIGLIEAPVQRDLLIDGSLYGMGKSAGNAPMELLASYMNEYCGYTYNVNQLLEAIDVTILDIYKKSPWGYSYKFFVSASNDCHPSYVSYLMDKKKLSAKSINEILSKIEQGKKLSYDRDYIEQLYIDYQKVECDDKEALQELAGKFRGQYILLMGPGKNIKFEKNNVDSYIQKCKPIIISVNFLPEGYPVDYIFMSNAKRYVQLSTKLSEEHSRLKLIATSNVTKSKDEFDYHLCYSRLLDEKALIVDNPMIMLLRLLKDIKPVRIALAGFDGYEKAAQPNYVNPNMEHTFSKEKASEINADVLNSMARLQLDIPVEYITKSLYNS